MNREETLIQPVFLSLGSLGIYLMKTIFVQAEKEEEKYTVLKITFLF